MNNTGRAGHTVLFLALLVTGMSIRSMAQDTKAPVKELLGTVAVEDLLDVPGWFGVEYATYEPSKYICDQIMEHLGETRIVCFLGTWCDDSRIQVPLFIKVLQSVNFDPGRLLLVAVDRSRTSPGGEQAQYNLVKVPTMIFFKGGRETGRIEEKPVVNLETDMLAYLQGKVPEPLKPDPGQDNIFITAPMNGDAPVPPAGQDGSVKTPDTVPQK